MNAASLAVALILVSAISHALVSVLIKRSHDKLILRLILEATTATIALPFLFILPPLPTSVWPILALGIGLHIIYQVTQAAAFTRGDMSLVYPVMRGFAPALTAVFALLFLNETLSELEIVGLGLVVAALVGFSWPGRLPQKGFAAALSLALFSGLLTGLYTVVDAKGVRLAPFAASFIAWIFVIEGTLGVALFAAWKHKGLHAKLRLDMQGGIMAGLLGLITSSTALYAYSLDAVAPLAALRETSVVFGAVFAALWLKEPFGGQRIALAVLLVLGLVFMQLA